MSTLKVTNIQATGETASRAVSGVAAAWVNFDGTGTIAERDSFNVASLTDNSTGNYTVNLTSSMSAASYSITTGGGDFHTASFLVNEGSFSILKYDATHTPRDTSYVSASIHGDLA